MKKQVVLKTTLCLLIAAIVLVISACGQTQAETNEADESGSVPVETINGMDTVSQASEETGEPAALEQPQERERPKPDQIYFSLREYLIGQEVGAPAEFCWNYLINYTITQNDDEHVFITAPATDKWTETWYWAKNMRDQDPDQWTFNANCRINENYGGTYLQLFFGTASKGGRYSLLINPADKGYVELYHDGIVANSWNPEMGACMRFGAGKDTWIEYGEVFHVTINNGLLETDDSFIEVLINDVPVLTYTADRVVMGDFGIGMDQMDAEVGDIDIREFKGFLIDLSEAEGEGTGNS